MLEKNDPYQLQYVERLISSFSSKIVQPPLVFCLNMQHLISQCNSPVSGGRCSAGGHGLPVQGDRGKEGLCLCLLLPYPVCSPALYLAALQEDVAEQGSFHSCTPWERSICCSDIEIHKWGFARSCVYFCV